MWLLKVASTLAMIFIITACATSSQTPSWYGKNTADSSLIVGFGSAKNLDSAKANALSDIVTQLNVQVDSHFSTRTQREDIALTHSSMSEVYLNSADIELSNVDYSKSVFQNGQFYIQAEVTKVALIAQFQKTFDKIYSALNLPNMSKCEILSIKDMARLEKAVKDLELYSSLLESLGSKAKSIAKPQKMLYANMPLPNAQLRIIGNVPEKVISDLSKELGHFYQLQNNATHTLVAKINTHITNDKNAKIDILFYIVDCQNNHVFSTNVSYESTNKKDALSFASQRVTAQLYKKIQEWIEEN